MKSDRGATLVRTGSGIRVAALALLLLAALLAALPWALGRWIDHALRDAFAARGIADVEIGAVRVGLRATTLERVAIGDDALVVPRARAEYGVGDLLRGRVSRLVLEGVRVQESLGGDAPGVLDDLAAGLAGGAGGGDGAPPFGALEVSDLRVALQTPAADIAVAVDGRLAHADGSWSGALDASVRSEPDRLRGTARVTTGPEGPVVALALSGDALPLGGVTLDSLALRLDAALAAQRLTGDLVLDATADTGFGAVALALPARLTFDLPTRRLTLDAMPGAQTPDAGGGRLSLVAQQLHLRGLRAELALAETPPRLHLVAADVRDEREPPRLPPLALDARLAMEDEALHAWGALQTAGARAVLRFDLHHDPDTGGGRVALDLPAVAFDAAGLQPADLSPLLAPLVATGGRVALEGPLLWGDRPLRSDLRLALEQLSGTLAGVSFEDLDLRLRLTRPWPAASPPDQTLEVARVTLGLDVERAAVRFALNPPGVVDVASARASLLGGTLSGAGRFDPTQPDDAFAIDASGLDLAALAERLRLQGLSATGRVSGRLPLARRDGAWFVEGGVLEADAKGQLRYRPAAGSPLASDDPRLRLLLDALRDFHYDALCITLAGPLAGDLEIRLHLAGASPDLYESHPVEFNLNLDAPITALLRDFGDIREIDLRDLGLEPSPARERRGGS